MPDTCIIPATSPEHMEQLRMLFRAHAAALDFDFRSQSFDEELASLPGKYAPPAGRLWLALHDGTPCGCIAFRPVNTHTCEMKRLYVRPDRRGHGLGRTLSILCLAAAREAGYAQMILDTLQSLQPAVKLYTSLGFKSIAPYYDDPPAGVVFRGRSLPGAIRPATNADGPAVRSLVFGVLAEYGLRPDPGCTDADLGDIEANYFARGGYFSVLTAPDGMILASAGIYPTAAGSCELRKMYLHREHRGRGLGRSLLEHALAQAHRLGFHHVTLETASVLKEAIALYQRYGFRPYTPTHLAARCDQAYELAILP